jgi:TPR repeat protein
LKQTKKKKVSNIFFEGVGVERHEAKAMEWFKKAADQGHPHASYNLAVGHLKGIKANLTKKYFFFSRGLFIAFCSCGKI